jgi:hypothetical protein
MQKLRLLMPPERMKVKTGGIGEANYQCSNFD